MTDLLANMPIREMGDIALKLTGIATAGYVAVKAMPHVANVIGRMQNAWSARQEHQQATALSDRTFTGLWLSLGLACTIACTTSPVFGLLRALVTSLIIWASVGVTVLAYDKVCMQSR